MSEDYGNDFVTLTDEEGNEYEFEIVRELEIDGERYAALLPVCTDENCKHDEDEDVYIVRITEENGEEIFEIIEDDEEFERVSAAFESAFEEEMDEDEESEDESEEE